MPSDFTDLLERLQPGSDADAEDVFRAFVPRLIGLARTRLHEQLRSKVDPEDVAQSVLRSFLTRNAADGFDLKDWGALWSVLAVITVRKCQRRYNEFTSGKRDVARERGDEQTRAALAMTDPTPEHAAALSELVELTMRQLDPRGRDILTMRLQGYTIPEIADALETSERTVHRQLSYVRAIFEGQLTG